MKNVCFLCNPAIKFESREHPWGAGRFYTNAGLTLEPEEGLASFRFDFKLPRDTARLVLRATSLGVFELFLNGARIGNEEMKPGWTDYHCRVFEFEYDALAFAKASNTLVAQVSRGWWSGRISMGEYGWNTLAFAAEIEALAADGSCLAAWSTADDGWKTTVGGRILFADIWDGEYFDATKPDITSEPDAYEWTPATRYTGSVPAVVSHVGEPVRYRPAFHRRPISSVLWRDVADNGTAYGKIVPLKRCVGDGCEAMRVAAGEKLILDMGQEMVGRPRLVLRAPRGARVEVMVGELLNDSGDADRGNDGPAGSMYIKNYRTAKARAVYIAAGENEETYVPSHAFYGFRYFQIRTDTDFELVSVQALFMSTDMTETGKIETDNAELNRFIENVYWGQRCNYLSIPTDCPQRDERLGWSGDTQMFCGAATYNANARGFLKKWLGDARDGQRFCAGYSDVIPAIEKFNKHGKITTANAAWADAGIIVPYVLYLKYNDLETLAEHYDSMEAYMEYLSRFGMHGPLEHYGDWLAYDPTPNPYISICYYAYDALLMSRMSRALGKKERAAYYTKLFEEIKAEYQKQYVQNGALTVTTQTACLLAIRFELVDGALRDSVIKLLGERIVENDYTLSTGFIGTCLLNQTLSDVGLDHLAYSLLLQTKDPSWLYSVRQGATTVWERWNSYTKETGFGEVHMNSFNHYAYGAVLEWMYESAAGIRVDPENPGFGHFILAPHPDTRKDADLPVGQKRIESIRAHYDTAYGRIESAWNWREGAFTYSFTIPTGSSARVEFPLLNGKDTILLNGISYTAAELGGRIEGGKMIFELTSGRYTVQ